MYVAQINPCDTQNGEGFRCSIFVSGCTLRCEDCFNPEAQNFRYGTEYDWKIDEYIKECVGKPHIDGLSILGGDPLERKNIGEVYNLCKEVKKLYPSKDIWLWTGRTYEQVKEDLVMSQILEVIDVLVDGKYDKHLKDESLMWRGSSNQRIIFLNQI